MTDEQKASVAYNEAKGISSAQREQIMKAIIDTLTNDDGKEPEAASPAAHVPNDAASQSAWQDAARALAESKTAGDTTNGATIWRSGSDAAAGSPHNGLPVLIDIGSFSSAGTSYIHMDFFHDSYFGTKG